jgi:MerR family transcriptional regulator, copper efflux regulator
MRGLTVAAAAESTGWSPRMLRYLERAELVVPTRSAGGYRLYGLRELNQLRALDELRRRFAVGLDELAFAVRLRREPQLRGAVETWLAGADAPAAADRRTAWVEWEQRKHERLLAA